MARRPPPEEVGDVRRLTRADVKRLRKVQKALTAVLVVIAVVALVFTATSVTLFAIRHGVHPGIAWLLDPMVALALGAVLITDGVLAEYGIKPRGWSTVLRYFAGLATWTMNAWESLWPEGTAFGVPKHVDQAGLVLHSIPPVLLIILAEAVTSYRRAILAKVAELEEAAEYASNGQPDTPRVHHVATAPVPEPGRSPEYTPYPAPDPVPASGTANGYPVLAETSGRAHPAPAPAPAEEPPARPAAEGMNGHENAGANSAPYGPKDAAEAPTSAAEGARAALPEHPFDYIARRAAEERTHAAAKGRTRAEVHAEYTPDPGPDPVPADDTEAPAEDATGDGGRVHPEPAVPDVPDEADTPEHPVSGDELTPRVRADFADELTAGRIPGVRPLRAAYGIGQPRAQRIRDELKGGQS
jgi:hypothetical protein